MPEIVQAVENGPKVAAVPLIEEPAGEDAADIGMV
jgi:hypothetical protein